MKFRCLECDSIMAFSEQHKPDEDTIEAVYICSKCGKRTSMITNRLETRLVTSPGAEVPTTTWSPDALDRLERAPPFVRDTVGRLYADYARDNGHAEVTTDVMDRARAALGLGGM